MLYGELKKRFHPVLPSNRCTNWGLSGKNTARQSIMMDMNGLMLSNIVRKYSSHSWSTIEIG